jgi:hypothetical protein
MGLNRAVATATGSAACFACGPKRPRQPAGGGDVAQPTAKAARATRPRAVTVPLAPAWPAVARRGTPLQAVSTVSMPRVGKSARQCEGDRSSPEQCGGMKAVDRLGDGGVQPAMGSHGDRRLPWRLLRHLEKEGNMTCEMGSREGRGRAWRWLPLRAGENGGESTDSGEVAAYRRPCSDTRQ